MVNVFVAASKDTENKCPICGKYSIDGIPCAPYCNPGNAQRAGIEEVPIGYDIARLGAPFSETRFNSRIVVKA